MTCETRFFAPESSGLRGGEVLRLIRCARFLHVVVGGGDGLAGVVDGPARDA